jgi:nucleotide-binding universal stress UspA family protein
MNTAVAEAATQISLKNILYATDFSPASEAAVPLVLGLARKHQARVHALHVRPTNPYWSMALEAAAQMIVTEQELAQRDADRLHGIFKFVPHDVTVAEGDIWAPLSEMISRHEIDLIVAGTHGRTGLAKAMLGSIAAEIIRSVPCPVLTVGPQAKLDPIEPATFRRILFATDLTPASLAAVPYAVWLARENHAHLYLLRVLEKESAGELATAGFYSEFEIKKLRELVPAKLGLAKPPECWVKTGDAAEWILKVAEDLRADLVVVGAKRTGGSLTAATHFSRATAQRVIAEALCPVLTVPQPNRDMI